MQTFHWAGKYASYRFHHRRVWMWGGLQNLRLGSDKVVSEGEDVCLRSYNYTSFWVTDRSNNNKVIWDTTRPFFLLKHEVSKALLLLMIEKTILHSYLSVEAFSKADFRFYHTYVSIYTGFGRKSNIANCNHLLSNCIIRSNVPLSNPHIINTSY